MIRLPLAYILPAVLLCLPIHCLLGQRTGMQTIDDMRKSPAGSQIIAFVEHFNQKQKTTAEDINSLFSKRLIDKLGEDRLLEVMSMIRNNEGQIELWDAKRAEMFKYELKGKGLKSKNWLDIVLRLEEQRPYKIDALEGISVSAERPAAKKAMLSPGNARETNVTEPTVNEQTIKQLKQWIQAQVDEGKFSGVVLVAKDFDPVFYETFGLASKRYNVRVSKETKFRLASVNKIFTATAILKLVEQKKLSLDDPVSKYIDGLADPRAENVTVRHLLTHSSGWGSYWGHPEFLNNREKLRSLDDYMAFIKDIKLDFDPGSKRQYSNSGYTILGAIIEKVTGQSYYDYVRNSIFKPAGMSSTDSFEIDHVAPNLATGYTNMNVNNQRSGTGYTYENIFTASVKGTSAGGGCSTSGDLLKFAEAVIKNKIVSKESEEFLRCDIGTKSEPGDFLFHNGGGPGQNTWVQSDVRTGYTIIVLCNLDPPCGSNVVRKISELFNLRMAL